MNAQNQQTTKISAFIEILTLAADPLIIFDWHHLATIYPLNSCRRVYLIFHRTA